MTTQQAFQIALKHHQGGRLAEAEAIYRQILEHDPGHGGTLHYLGIIAHDFGDHEAGLDLMRRAVKASPSVAEFHSNLASRLCASGKVEEAIAAFRRALKLKPDDAEDHHNLGVALRLGHRYPDAIASFRRALALHPDFAEAHCNLGSALSDNSQPDEAIAALTRALEINPDFAEALSNLGDVLTNQGRVEEAVSALRRALKIRPQFAEAHCNLGRALRVQGHLSEAIEEFKKAIEIKPDLALAHSNLGTSLAEQGRIEEAIPACRRAIKIQPDLALAHNNLGKSLGELGLLDEAITSCRRATALKPDWAEARSNLGYVLGKKGLLRDAIAAHQKAIALEPGFAGAHSNHGNTLVDHGLPEEAVAAHGRAIALEPWNPATHNNLALALEQLGQVDDAVAACKRALELRPGFAEAKSNCGMMLLLRGDFADGWPLYEARSEAHRNLKRSLPQPMWDGGPLEGRRVLIHAEQGFGDSLQFIRFAFMVAQRGGAVIVECQRPLLELFRNVAGVAQVVASGDSLPSFDLHIPMLSLPGVFKTTLDTIPREVPYLTADPARCAAWRERLGGSGERLRVGLVWAGRPTHARDRFRSIRLAELMPLLDVEGVDFFSVQRERGSEELRTLSAPATISDHTASIESFADTAALLTHLDLLISVDTAVLHLAGALGKPVWALLPFAPDWRWMLGRGDNTWYPTMRLFRQPSIMDWKSVVSLVRGELESLVQARTSRGTSTTT